MPRNSVELRQERAKLTADARKLIDAAKLEKRELRSEEQEQFDRMMAEVDATGDVIGKIEKQERDYQRLLEIDAENTRSAGRKTDPVKPGAGVESRKQVDSEARERRIATDVRFRRSTGEYRKAFRSYLVGGFRGMGTEARALQADSDIVGGYLVAPMRFSQELIKFVDDMVFVRQFATVEQLPDAQSLGVPSLDTDPADADWTAEITSAVEDTAMRFGRRELNPHLISKQITVSQKLLRLSSRAEAIVRDRLAYKFAVTQEKGFLTGTGAGQALGVFTASSNGVSTARDVSTGNSSTAIGADNLFEVFYSLKEPYRKSRSFAWCFHRDGVKSVRKLKDTQNQYLWQPALSAGEPDTLLGVPVKTSEYAPNTFTTGLYVGILGDWSKYMIAEATNMNVQRLDELYARTNQVGFIGRMDVDGMPALEEAFARVKLA